MEFNGKLDTKEIENSIKNTELNLTKIIQRITASVNREVIKEAKKNYKNNFSANNHNYYYPEKSILKGFKTGELKSNYSKELVKNGGVNVNSYVMNKVYYSLYLENGANITARENYLTFKINNQFVKVKSVSIPANHFTLKAIQDFWNTGKYQPIAEAELQKQLTKYWSSK